MQKKRSIKEYCISKRISVAKFSYIVGVSYPYIRKIGGNPKLNVSIQVISMIYNKTLDHFGDGLSPQEYLDHDILKCGQTN